jgi:Zn-dependent protease with chaperone function
MPRSDAKTRARLDFLEWEARTRPRRHRLRLLALAALGYLYPLALLAGTLGVAMALLLAAPFVWDAVNEGAVLLLYGLAVVLVLLLVAAVTRTFMVDLPDPPGQPLAPGEAPELRAMLDEVCRALGSPPVQRIHVTAELNAAAAQRPRYGFWGRRMNQLVIGLPLLAALTPEQLRAVLAHECGHLIGRHSSFTAWVYRIQQTWEQLAAPFAKVGWLRTALLGWFVRWFGGLLSVDTLATRRLHEYEADRRSAGLCGATLAAHTLLRIDWSAYRLAREFWPAALREAAGDPLPPADVVGRITAFLATEPPPDAVRRWRRREQQSLTPVTDEHPCLGDRLAALGAREMLEREPGDGLVAEGLAARTEPDQGSLRLLGDSRQRLCAVANASWKAMAIERWRAEHAEAKQVREKLAKQGADAGAASGPAKTEADREWERIQLQAEYAPPEEAMARLREFHARFPEHAPACFTLGRLLLERDDEAFGRLLETAMRHDSGYIGPALNLMLDYYRNAGRDRDADPLLRRLDEHRRALARASAERLKVRRGDRFLPHDLSPADVEKLRRVLNAYPQVTAAYFAKKQVRLFTDKPSYVLAVKRRPRLFEDQRKADRVLADCLRSHVNGPCAVVILSRAPRSVRSRLLGACPTPLFVAPD